MSLRSVRNITQPGLYAEGVKPSHMTVRKILANVRGAAA